MISRDILSSRLTIFQVGGSRDLGLLAKQPQGSVEVRLSLTNESDRDVSHSNFYLIIDLIYVAVSAP